MDKVFVDLSGCNPSYATDYQASWGCDGSDCNLNDSEARFSAYINIPNGAPTISGSTTFLQQPKLCESELIAVLEDTNQGSGSGDAILDAAFDYHKQISLYSSTLNSAYLIDGNGNETTNLTSYFTNSGSYVTLNCKDLFTSDPDGSGQGLEDLDKDGYFDDLPVGNTLKIKITLDTDFSDTFKNTFLSEYSSTGTFVVYGYHGYKTVCDRYLNNGTSLFYTLNQNLQISKSNIATKLEGPSDIRDGEIITYQQTLYGRISEYYGLNFDKSNSKISVEYSLPDGLTCQSIKCSTSGGLTDLNFTQSGTQLWLESSSAINSDLLKINLQNSLILTFQYDYPDSGAELTNLIKSDWYYYLNAHCPEDRLLMGSEDFDIFPLNVGGDIEMLSFNMNRNIFGIPYSYKNYYYGDFFGSNAIDRMTIEECQRPDLVIAGDEVKATINGKINLAGNYDHLNFNIQYQPIISGQELFEYLGGSVKIGGVSYDLSTITPQVSDLDGNLNLLFSVPLTAIGAGTSISAGTEIEFDGIFQVANIEGQRVDIRIQNLAAKMTAISGSSEFNGSFIGSSLVYKERYLSESGYANTYDPDDGVMGSWIDYGRFSNSNIMGTEYRGTMYMSRVVGTAPSGYKFTTLAQQRGIGQIETISPDRVQLIDGGKQFVINLDDSEIIGYDLLNHWINLVIDDETFEFPPLGQNKWVVWDADVDYVVNANQTPEEHEIRTKHIHRPLIFNLNKGLSLTTNDIQEGFSDEVRWPIQLSAYGNTGNIQNTYIAVELRDDDPSTVLVGIEDANHNALEVSYYGADNPNDPEGSKRYMLANIGTLTNNTQKDFYVVGRYLHCVNDYVQDIDIYAGWKYSSPIDVSGRINTILDEETKLFPIQKDTLSIRYKTADLQWQISKVGEEAGNLCEPHIFDVYLLSSKYADMHDLKVSLDLPNGVLVDGNTPLQFQYPSSGEFIDCPEGSWYIEDGKTVFNMETIMGQNYLPGTRSFDNDIHLRFGLTTDCTANIDISDPILFDVHGVTNCGDIINYKDQRKLIMDGFTPDLFKMVAYGTAFSYCDRNSVVAIQLTNLGDEPSQEQQLILALPEGIEYAAMTDNMGFPAPVITDDGAGSLLSWQLSAGYLAANDLKTIELNVNLTGEGGKAYKLHARSFMEGELTCPTDSSTCHLMGTTGEADISIASAVTSISAVIEPDVTLPECLGTSLNLVARAVGMDNAELNYKWYFNGDMLKDSSDDFFEIASLSSNSAGIYKVLISTDAGCTEEGTFELLQSHIRTVPTASILELLSTTCDNIPDGSVRFVVNGLETRTFYYELLDEADAVLVSDSLAGGAEGSYDQLTTGTYRIRITDPNGCMGYRSFTVRSGAAYLNVRCTGNLPCNAVDGESFEVPFTFIVNRARALPNTTEYIYEVRNSSGENMVLEGSMGTYNQEETATFDYDVGEHYTVRFIEDADLCGSGGVSADYQLNFSPVTYTVTMNEESGVYRRCYTGQPLNIVAQMNLTRSFCSVDFTGTYDVNLYQVDTETGERTGIPISAYDGSGTLVLPTDLPVGNYVQETAINDTYFGNCSASSSFKIAEPATIEAKVFSYDVNCQNGNDGRAIASVTGGYPDYNYYWYTAGGELISRAEEVTGLWAGDYYLKVEDSRECQNDDINYPFTINDGLPMGNITVTVPDENGTDCEISASISNALEGETYRFKWIRIVHDEDADGNVITYENISFEQAYTVGPSETTAMSVSDLSTVVPGDYYLTVITSGGCVQSTLEQTIQACPEHVIGSTFPIRVVDVDRNYHLCFNWKTRTKEVKVEEESGINEANLTATLVASEMAYDFIDAAFECGRIAGESAKASFEDLCLSTDKLDDKLTIRYNTQSYHYTLYYYDRAGNLVKTVPPAGVNPLSDDELSRDNYPAHALVTNYEYNSLGQLVSQNTPDAGTTNFIYNNNGQLRFSQNAQQVVDNTFSYSKYDELGRVVETGQAKLNASAYSSNGVSITASSFDALKPLVLLDALSYAELPIDERFPVETQELEQQTYTYYSQPTNGINVDKQAQRYLLNRVSHTAHYNADGQPVATYFSYDPHGNVEWMVQKLPGIKSKSIRYHYDLISGNVTQVAYNKGKADQFFHRYEYDEDNRIEKAETSPNGMIWETDARYEYYKHGPLQRTVLGEDQVQGLDYVYTLQGWLKAINNPTLAVGDDPGHDGQNTTGRDVFGMVLSYFDGDFKNSNSPFDAAMSPETKPADGRDLYNGNIAAWTHQTADLQNGALNYDHLKGQQFTYDVLNRIKSSSFVQGANTGEYQTDYSYDPNGNLMTLNRNAGDATDTDQAMDRLTYSYYDNTNRLQRVDDTVDATKFTDDVDPQSAGDNYIYDEIGNLIGDKAENIANIEWTVAGKVAKVTKTDNTTISFEYDALGNRVKKELATAAGLVTATYYVRDASGNIMAVYDERKEDVNGDKLLTLAEQPIYGSSRLGMHLGDPSKILQRRRAK